MRDSGASPTATRGVGTAEGRSGQGSKDCLQIWDGKEARRASSAWTEGSWESEVRPFMLLPLLLLSLSMLGCCLRSALVHFGVMSLRVYESQCGKLSKRLVPWP